jgi:hypothetical protein
MRVLKQSVAAQVMVLMVNSDDGKTGLDGLTLTVTLSKNGGAFAAITPTVTPRGSGWYSLALTTAHVDTLGDLAVHIESTGADQSDRLCVVETATLSDVDTETDAIVTAISTLPSIVLPVMQGSAYTATATQQRTITVIQGDTPTITFDLGSNYTGWSGRFAAKASASDAGYAIPVRAAAWVDATRGTGKITLSSADTAATGRYLAELELSGSGQVLTALKFVLIIQPQIIA